MPVVRTPYTQPRVGGAVPCDHRGPSLLVVHEVSVAHRRADRTPTLAVELGPDQFTVVIVTFRFWISKVTVSSESVRQVNVRPSLTTTRSEGNVQLTTLIPRP